MKKKILAIPLLAASLIQAQLYAPNSVINGTANASTGNIGIGINSPLAKFEVNGDIANSFGSGGRLTLHEANVSRGNKIMIYANENGANIHSAFSNGGSSSIIFHTGGGMTKFDSNGNVGIGTMSASNKLTISGRHTGINQGKASSGPTSTAILRLETGFDNSSYGEVLDFGMNVLDSYGWIQAQNRQNASTAYGLSLNPLGGNVGIGTDRPQYKLEINNGGDIALRAQTTDSGDLIFLQNSGQQNARIWSNDKGGLYLSGRDNDPDFTLMDNGNASLQGKFEAKEIKVTTTPTADFVFEEDYKLPTLEEVEKHIKAKKHLPEIASAKEMEKEGVNVGEFQIKLLQKIEELTLYSIEQNKKIELLNKKIDLQCEEILKLKQN